MAPRRKLKKLKKQFKHCANLLVPVLIEEIERELCRPKRIWTRPWMLRKDKAGSATLLRELEEEDLSEFKSFMRMNLEQFEHLLDGIAPIIQKEDTVMRAAITAKEKLQITLCYLATGVSYRFLQGIFRVSEPSISRFVPEVADAIYEYLKDYIKVPSTDEEWNEIENGFNTRWNIPGCYGSIDGKHFPIVAPPNCGSEYWSYKDCNSIVLLAIVDHDYCFRYINVGSKGRNSDGGIFRDSLIYDKLENGLLPSGGFIVGDDAFPLKPYLLKPFSHSPLTVKQRILNYRLSRARRIVENAFGILSSKFRLFQKSIPTSVDVTEKVIRTACAIHNYLKISNPGTYAPRGTIDFEDIDAGVVIPGSWRREVNVSLPSIDRTRNLANHSSRQARELRDRYADYFAGNGAVPWQNRMVF